MSDIVLTEEEKKTYFELFEFITAILSEDQDPPFIDMWIEAEGMPEPLVDVAKEWKGINNNEESQNFADDGDLNVDKLNAFVPALIKTIGKFSIKTKDLFIMESPPQVEAIDAKGKIEVEGDCNISIFTKNHDISISEDGETVKMVQGEKEKDIAKSIAVFLSTFIKIANQLRLEKYMKESPSLTGLSTYKAGVPIEQIIINTAKEYFADQQKEVEALAKTLLEG